MCKREKVKSSLLSFFLGSFLVLALPSAVLISSPVSAGDELYLTGILRSVDVKSGTIVMDVLSQSCPGLRRFSIENAGDLRGSEGVKFSFTINSSSCKGAEIYRIVSALIRNGG